MTDTSIFYASSTPQTIAGGDRLIITFTGSLTPAGPAVSFDLSSSGTETLENCGTIAPTSGPAIATTGSAGALPVDIVIDNCDCASITSSDPAILIDDGSGGDAFATVDIYNGGTIIGSAGEAIVIVNSLADLITNCGTIDGSVSTGGGADEIDNCSTITGALDTGGDDDTIFLSGTSTIASIDGGDGTDAIIVSWTTGTLALTAVSHVETLEIDDGIVSIADDQSYASVTLAAGATLALGGATLDGAIDNEGAIETSGAAELSGLVSGAGSVEVVDGTLRLDGANDYSGGTTLGGSLEVVSEHGAGSGAILFGDGAQTLTIDLAALTAGDFANSLDGFGTEDRIDLAGIGAATGVTLGADNVLTVSGGTTEVTLHLDPTADYSGAVFSLVSDGAGGTFVTYDIDSLKLSDGGSVAENSAGGTVVATFTGHDIDGDTLTYTLTDDAGGLFVLDSNTGVLTLAGGAVIDYETASSYLVQVQATDGLGEILTSDFQIDVTDVDEPRVYHGTPGDDSFVAPTPSIDSWTVYGGRGDDLLVTADGNDLVYGGLGDDLIDTGGGDDVIAFSGNASANGYDAIYGGCGYDVLRALADNTQISWYDLDGIEQIDGAGHANVTISGSFSYDVIDLSYITLTDIAAIRGGGGDDAIIGSAGDDLIWGDAGNDLLVGGDGNDVFRIGANNGIDLFDGGCGFDTILATADDVAIGIFITFEIEAIDGAGYANVSIVGTSYADLLDFSCMQLTDIAAIRGGSGADLIIGSAGNDVISGGYDNDDLVGGGGDDVFTIGLKSGTDLFDGGDGFDTILATTDNAKIGIAGIVDVEAIDGGGFANVSILGTGAADLFDFSAVELTDIAAIRAGAGNDIILGSTANDAIWGGTGNDQMSGGDGDDLFVIGPQNGTDSFDGGDGFDTIRASAAKVAIGIGAIAGVEAIDGNGFGNVTIAGTSGADVFDFGSTLLTDIAAIRGGTGNDSITGSVGNDLIWGDAGNDQLAGGSGDDVFGIGANNGTDSIDGGDGFDTIVAAAANVKIALSAISGVESIEGGGFANVTIIGTSAADTLDLTGATTSGIALIDLGQGNDTLIGSDSDDLIRGNAGADMLSGGLGSDRFIYSTVYESRASAIDTITDLTPGTDLIDLSRIDANTRIGGDQAFTFIDTDVFHKVAGELRIDHSVAGTTSVLGDINGDGRVDFAIHLTGDLVLTGSDFLF